MIAGLSIIIPMLIAFVVSYWYAPYHIRLSELEGLAGHDMAKPNKPLVAEMGTPVVVIGFFFGLFAFIGGQTFITNFLTTSQIAELLAVMCTVLIITVLGMMDDLTRLIKEREGNGYFESLKRKGLNKVTQIGIPLLASLPLIAVNAGVSSITIPFLGQVNVGLLYPLVLIPLAITGTANATNMLAGFNGMQVGLNMILMLFLGTYSYLTGSTTAAIIAFIYLGALIAFWRYNWYPSRIFPGGYDYLAGAMVGVIAIIGNIEKFAILCFVPWFIEFGLKALSKFKAQTFGVLQTDGKTLKPKDEKIRSWTHIVMRMGNFTEQQIVLIMMGIVFVWCSIVSAYFYFF